MNLSDIIAKQAIFIVGTTGHVMHGKSTLVQRLTEQRTQRHQSEIEGNKSINLGYANCKIWRKADGSIISTKSDVMTAGQLLCHISFADCPGHEDYMSAMINGTSVMDHAFVVIAGNESVPRSQTIEHIKALDYGEINNRTYILNKLDLLKEEKAEECHQSLVKFLLPKEETIIPISAMSGAGLSYVINDLLNNEVVNRSKFLEKTKGSVRMNIVRSYNINKPSITLKQMQGAVIGGTLTSGVLAVGDYIEIRPGVICMHEGVKHVRPLYAKVTDLRSENNKMSIAVPGGLIGVGLTLYAGLSGANRLVGQIMGHPGTLPNMYDKIFGKFSMIDETIKFAENQKVQLVANGVMIVNATIVHIKKTKIEFEAQSPLVLDANAKLAIMVNNKLVAHFVFLDGDLSMPVLTQTFDFMPKAYTIIDDLHHDRFGVPSYDIMAKEITYRSTKQQKVHLYIPQLNLINKSSYITKNEWDLMLASLTHSNTNTTSTANLSVNLSEVIRSNMEREFNDSKPRFDQQGSLIVDFRMNIGQLTGFLSKVQAILMKCPSCHSTRTILLKGFKRECLHCQSVSHMPSLHI